MSEKRINNQNQVSDDDRAIERLLESCEFAPVDTGRIKQLTYRRIAEADAARKRRIRSIFAGTLSAAACLALIVTVGLHFFSHKSIDVSTATPQSLAENHYKELVVPAGQRREVKLSDGTRLIANAHTRLLYPEKFQGKERRIYADGEVFLQVAKDRKHPFVVESDRFDVRVLGTVFNICNSTDSTASVVLVEGSVQIDMEDRRSIRLKPNDMAELLNGDVTSLTKVDTDEYTSWINGVMCLKGMPMSVLAKRLSDHYGRQICCRGSLGDVKVYGKLDLKDNIDTVIGSIQHIVPMHVTRSGNSIELKP